MAESHTLAAFSTLSTQSLATLHPRLTQSSSNPNQTSRFALILTL
ncbi:MAG: hypothetical protein ACXWE7_08800 [Nitrososphaeraceae archaeon]